MRSNKYNAKPSNGFPSKLESAVYDILRIRENAKEIKDIRRQHAVKLTDAQIGYKVDFSYTDIKSGQTVWAEAKGFETEAWLLKKRLWRFYGPGNLEIYKGSHLRPVLSETIVPK